MLVATSHWLYTSLQRLGFDDEGNPSGLRDPQRCRPVCDQLREYLAGTRTRFDLALAPSGTPFQQRVWRGLTDIPYGAVCGYGDLARSIGNPGAARAVGQANGANPIPIIIPCHRVIHADGSISGYGGGVDRKKWLLRHEADNLPFVLGATIDVAPKPLSKEL